MPTAAEMRAAATEAREAAKAALAAADQLAADARRVEREERQAKKRAENAAHYARMYDDIGQGVAGLNEAQHGIVYSKAWEHGHSSGYGEVESYYGEFAQMAREILDAK